MNKQLILNSDACFILIRLMFQSDRSEVLIRYTASGQQTPFQMFALRWGVVISFIPPPSLIPAANRCHPT